MAVDWCSFLSGRHVKLPVPWLASANWNHFGRSFLAKQSLTLTLSRYLWPNIIIIPFLIPPFCGRFLVSYLQSSGQIYRKLMPLKSWIKTKVLSKMDVYWFWKAFHFLADTRNLQIGKLRLGGKMMLRAESMKFVLYVLADDENCSYRLLLLSLTYSALHQAADPILDFYILWRITQIKNAMTRRVAFVLLSEGFSLFWGLPRLQLAASASGEDSFYTARCARQRGQWKEKACDIEHAEESFRGHLIVTSVCGNGTRGQLYLNPGTTCNIAASISVIYGESC